MKPFLKLFISFLSIAILMTVVNSSALSAGATVVVNDGQYEYTYTDGAWTLYSYIGNDNEITLPTTYAGSQVRRIGDNCFASGGLTSVTIPQGYTSIGEYAFENCAVLSELSIPSSISEIGEGAFKGTSIDSLDLSGNKLAEIAAFTFKDCSLLGEVSLPKSLVRIGESAFCDSGIEHLNIPGKITKLEANTFKNTSSLESVDLPPHLIEIGAGCFENSALNAINLPDMLATIGDSAFKNAFSLSQLYIPNSVSSIGAYALYPMSTQSRIEVTCFENSYAEEYCYENFVKNLKTYAYIIGDADLSGKVSISDATLIQKYKAGLKEITNPCARILCDANRDETISVRDATLIQMRLAEIITDFE